MATTLINPFMSFPPAPPAATLIDDFIGSDGASFNTSIWDHNNNTTHNALREILSNSLLMSTGNTGGYVAEDSNCIRTDSTYSDAEIQFIDFEWDSSSVDQEMNIKLGMRGSSYLDWYLTVSASSLYLEFLPYDHTARLWKVESESYTALSSTVTFTTLVGGNPVAGDKWNIALRHTGTTFDAYIWLSSGSRPGSPSITASESTFTSAGKVSIGCGNNATATQRKFKVGSVLRAS